MRNYWRIGVKYVDLEMFKRGYPYVWDVLDSDDLEILKEIQPGDIIVAGGIEKISFIGEVLEKPVALFISQQPMPYIQCNINVAGPATIEAFEPIESNYNDIVCIKTKWFDIDCQSLHMPAQVRGRIRKLNFAGEACIHGILKGNVAKAVPAINPLLSFTAIDFETASNKRNSVCQVGLVKVVNGVIVDEYCGLIQPPDNFINKEFSARIHGIYPEHTANAPTFAESYPHWRHYIEGQSLVAHNIKFDSSCLKACLKSFLGREAYMAYAMNMREEFCTMKIWRGAFENAQLATCCAQLGINLAHHHNAIADARACAELFMEAIHNGRTLY